MCRSVIIILNWLCNGFLGLPTVDLIIVFGNQHSIKKIDFRVIGLGQSVKAVIYCVNNCDIDFLSFAIVFAL